MKSLIAAYEQLPIGSPLEAGNLVGPLIDEAAVEHMQEALAEVKKNGGKILHGGQRKSGLYVVPAIVEAKNDWPVVQHETFAPILYVMGYATLAEAIALQNGVPQGLSSAIFTTDLREAEQFLPRPAAIAASPTSTSAPAAPRSAAPSAARRKPAAAARAGPTRGRRTCAGRPSRSTTRMPCRWRRGSSSAIKQNSWRAWLLLSRGPAGSWALHQPLMGARACFKPCIKANFL